MTPKELCVLIVKEPLVLIGLSSQKVIDIAQAYLNLESRIQKLEAVVDAAIRITQPSDWANYNKRVALVKAVDELEQE